MKLAQITDLLANIKATLVSFFSILMFVTLGVAVFLGISWAAPALQNAADDMFDKGSLHNLQVQYQYGLTDDDVKKLSEIDGISQVEAERQSCETIRIDNRKYTVKVQSLGQSIDTPFIVEGELPAKSGEMALHAESAKQLGVNVGDTITFEKDEDADEGDADAGKKDAKADESEAKSDKKDGNADKGDASADESDASADKKDAESDKKDENADGKEASADEGTASSDEESESSTSAEPLVQRSFTVTALVNNAEYVADASATYGYSTSPSGAVDALAWVVDADFDASAFHDGYPIVNVRCDSLNGYTTFSDEYKAASKEIEQRITELGEPLSQRRYEELRDDAQGKIDDAQKKLDDARKEVADGEKKIEDAKKEIADGEKKIADGEKEISDGEAEVADGHAKISEGESKLSDARAELNSQKKKGQKKLDEAEAKLKGPEEAYRKAEAEYQAGKSANDALQAACNAARQEIESAKAAYESAVVSRQAFEDKHPAPRSEQDEKELESLRANEGAAKQRVEAAQSATINVNGTAMPLDQASQAAAANAAKLAEAKGELDSKKAELEAVQKELDSAKAKYDAEVAKGQAKINKAESQLEDARAQVAQGERDLENAKSELADSKKKLEDGKKELKDKQKELEDAKVKLSDKTDELEDAKHDLEQMESLSWSVAPRSHNGGAGQISMFSDVTNNLSISMAALFIIVGLLVSYFAVSRIVAEHITQIGTKKALGMRRSEITVSYLCYSGLAVVLGSILGGAVAYFIVEGIISSTLADMFVLGSYPAYFGWGLFFAIFAIELVLVLGATFLACRRILKKHAIELLRGPEPPMTKMRFYERWSIWEKLPLLIQTIVNNCMNDKRRVLSTIVGVTGCTALIVTAITLNNDVMKSYYRQYDEVYGFNAIAYVESEPEDAAGNLESALEREGATTAQILKKRYLVEQPNGESGSMSLIVPVDEDAFSQIYHVNPVTDGSFDLSADGAWVSQAYAAHFGAKVGDAIIIDSGNGTKHEVPILGFYEFWLTNHEMVVGKGYFEKEFGDAEPNAVLAQTGDVAFDDLEASLASVEGFDSIVDDATKQKGDFDTFSSVSGSVVFIYLVLATLMAIVVLLNLNVMFIDEKRRELIVLMINGFSVKDARHYVSYDNVVLTILGVIVGLVLGCIMGSVTVASVEPVTGVFVKSIDAWAVAIGALGSIVLAAIMSLIALRRISKFKLIDINRF